MFIELHLLQSFPPANLNRDDTNNPKECEFGGVRRARISSQCIKRAIRIAPVFQETTRVPSGTRTKRVGLELRRALLAEGRDGEEAEAVVKAFVPAYFGKLDSRNEDLTAVLVYVSEAEIRMIQEALIAHWEELQDEERAAQAAQAIARDVTRAFQEHTTAPDIALFGRMLAERPETNLEAACQVAHAISTHRVSLEMDFFTAIDELQPPHEQGASMLGFSGYNSACFYRYARVDWEQLLESLAGDLDLARRTVEGFLRAAEEAIPSGKQSGYAAYNPPSLALGVVRRRGMGWSLSNAFERPVRASREGGFVEPSILALDRYWGQLCRNYGEDTLACVATRLLAPDLRLASLADTLVASREAWLGALLGALPGGEGTLPNGEAA